ncbi:NapC/NirT family cytochrome c [Gemmatimonadota bacterium]
MSDHPDESELEDEILEDDMTDDIGQVAPDEDEELETKRFPRYVYNPISLTGAALAIAMLFAIIIIFIVDASQPDPNPYIGILGFAIFPIPFILGLLLIPFGMWIVWRRVKQDKPALQMLPTLDMNKSQHRVAFFTFTTGTILFLFLSAGGFYKLYEYTESVAFCGTTCHTVMEPEHTTYLVGPHARVKCVECHIGEGTEWYVRSKLSGAYQVYSVLFNKYQRPIPTPIENLRPARETCEHCHWPEKFHGNQMWEVNRYLSDEQNTRWNIQMVMNTGGTEKTGDENHSIHWHIAQTLEYVAADSTRREIREVRQHRPDATVEVFRSLNNPLAEEESAMLPEEDIRVMDCMDCHNRPSHQYLSPRHAMDQAIERDRIPADLPFIKRIGTNLLADEYQDRETGMQAIETEIIGYYQENYPLIATSRIEDVNRSITGVQQLYSTYFFPAMNARWSAYPSHIGHQEFPGCFRCHNGMMATDEGKLIRNDCQLCHTIIGQGFAGADFATSGLAGLEFRHPEDIGEAWRFMSCTDCHTGGEYY